MFNQLVELLYSVSISIQKPTNSCENQLEMKASVLCDAHNQCVLLISRNIGEVASWVDVEVSFFHVSPTLVR